MEKEKEYDLIRESKKRLIVCPDTKGVHEAVNLINKGQFSTSSRMSSFLLNMNIQVILVEKPN